MKKNKIKLFILTLVLVIGVLIPKHNINAQTTVNVYITYFIDGVEDEAKEIFLTVDQGDTITIDALGAGADVFMYWVVNGVVRKDLPQNLTIRADNNLYLEAHIASEAYYFGYERGYDDAYDEYYQSRYDLGYDDAYDEYYQSRYDEGYDEGSYETYYFGYDEGYDDAYDEYYQSRFDEGLQEGIRRGTENDYDWTDFVPGILGVVIHFVFQIGSIGILGITLLDILGVAVILLTLSLVFKFLF